MEPSGRIGASATFREGGAFAYSRRLDSWRTFECQQHTACASLQKEQNPGHLALQLPGDGNRSNGSNIF